jgi:hypothetical protein
VNEWASIVLYKCIVWIALATMASSIRGDGQEMYDAGVKRKEAVTEGLLCYKSYFLRHN